MIIRSMKNDNDVILTQEIKRIEFQKAFGKNIKRLRQQQELTQDRLGYLAELDRSYIGGIERGERNVCLSNIKRIADALKVSVNDLFNFKEATTYEELCTND
uniref:C.ClaIP n=1 Tax=Caryophanon latum TaxID=33977 RepID=F1KC46_9BACL|nr:C.ClaIP [Caryophanon latum]